MNWDRAAAADLHGTQFTILRGMDDHLSFALRLLDFRHRIRADRNASTDPAWFTLNSVDSCRNPVSVLMLEGGEITGAILLREQMRYGIGLGYLFACDAAGDEFILARPDKKADCLCLCVTALLKKFPSWIISLAAKSDYSFAEDSRISCVAAQSTARYRLRLLPSLDATFEKFGSHTRRNFRYYAKKLSQDNALFHGALSDEQGQAVAMELLSNVDYPITRRLLQETVAASLRTPGHFFAGLQANDNSWLSLIVGWREGTCTKVIYQMNHRDFRKASLSVASRSFLIKYEIEHGNTEIAFISYTTGSMQNGFVDDLRYDIVIARKSWRFFLVMWLAGRFLPENHRLRRLASATGREKALQ